MFFCLRGSRGGFGAASNKKSLGRSGHGSSCFQGGHTQLPAGQGVLGRRELEVFTARVTLLLLPGTSSGLAPSRRQWTDLSLTQFVPLHPFPASTPFLPNYWEVLPLGLAEVHPAVCSLLVNLFNPAPWSQADQPAALSGGQCFYNLFS